MSSDTPERVDGPRLTREQVLDDLADTLHEIREEMLDDIAAGRMQWPPAPTPQPARQIRRRVDVDDELRGLDG